MHNSQLSISIHQHNFISSKNIRNIQLCSETRSSQRISPGLESNLAQASRSRLGETPNREQPQNLTKLSLRLGSFAQTRFDSRSSDVSSPRQDLTQHQGWFSGIFAEAETTRLGEIIRISSCLNMQATQFMPNTNSIIYNCSHSSINIQFMQFQPISMICSQNRMIGQLPLP